jgi:protein TonB
MALSLALHGLAVVLLFAAGASGSSSLGEPALFVEVAFTVAPTIEAAEQAPEVMAPAAEETEATEATEATKPLPTLERAVELVPTEQPPAVDVSHLKPIELAPSEEPPPPDFSALKPIELLAAQEPPPVKASELKPAQPARPASRPKVEQARPAPKLAAPKAQPNSNFGNAGDAQAAASGFLPAPIVFEGKPRFRHPPTPAVYPPRAIELDQQGEVVVRVRLDTAGTAVEIVLHRSCGHQLLDRAALAAVRQWHFHPAVRDGRPVAAWVEIPVRFHLR